MRVAVVAVGLLFAGFGLAGSVRATDSPSKGPFPRGALIRYVVLGDSAQGSAPAWYSDDLGRDLGVRVALDDKIVGGSAADWWVTQLRTDKRLRADLRKANVITFNVPLAIVAGCDPISQPRFRSPAALRRCMAGTVASYKRDVEAIFATLVALRPPSKALIRATDTWQFNYRAMHKVGLYAVIKPYWQRYNAIVHKVAARYRIPVVHAYAAMNGATGNKDPIAAGYVSTDEFHLTVKGHLLLAKLYRNLGYRLAPAAPYAPNNPCSTTGAFD